MHLKKGTGVHIYDNRSDTIRMNGIAQLREGLTFGNFVARSTGQVAARTALMALVDELAGVEPHRLPLPQARLYHLYGRPGRGKTHLMEAFLNEIQQRAPQLFRLCFLDRKNFTHSNMVVADMRHHRAPIICVDEMFKEQQIDGELEPNTDVVALINWILAAYELRPILVVTSNFPMLGKPVSLGWPWGQGWMGTGLGAPRPDLQEQSPDVVGVLFFPGYELIPLYTYGMTPPRSSSLYQRIFVGFLMVLGALGMLFIAFAPDIGRYMDTLDPYLRSTTEAQIELQKKREIVQAVGMNEEAQRDCVVMPPSWVGMFWKPRMERYQADLDAADERCELLIQQAVQRQYETERGGQAE
jgi:hypothetical protein